MCFICLMCVCTGGNSEDPQDAQENQQCSVADRARRDTEEHVSAIKEDD